MNDQFNEFDYRALKMIRMGIEPTDRLQTAYLISLGLVSFKDNALKLTEEGLEVLESALKFWRG